MNTAELSSMSKQVRRDIINMTANAGSGHPGGSLSAADLMTCLFFNHMHVDPKHPDDPNRDRFVLSKGHAAPCYYAVLAEMGFISRDEIKNYRQLRSILQGHPDSKKVPGVDAATGSLGQGCSIAVGMALGAKVQHKDCKVYTLLGDGECQEGQIWESFMAAAHYHLDNLPIIIDNNGLQIDGPTAKVMNSEPLDQKMDAFGFNTIICNGNSLADLEQAFILFDRSHGSGKPTCFLLHTTKGLGESFKENAVDWHGKAPNDAVYDKAMAELRASYEVMEKEAERING